jgi:F-type H+-transporting ATPase subunit a
MINIELKPEYVVSAFGVPLTNSFLTTLLVSVLLVLLSVAFYLNRNRKSFAVELPRVVVYELLKMTDAVTRDRALSKRILPLVATFFIFILSANLIALLPGFLGSLYLQTAGGTIPALRSPNSDLTTTLALAAIAVFGIQVISLGVLGLRRYVGRFIDLSGFANFVTGLLELVSEAVKVLSFSFRLFCNIFAGEVLLVVMAFLVPYFLPLPFMVLEVFVGVIQAFIFAMLTLTFIKTSVMRHVPDVEAVRRQA